MDEFKRVTLAIAIPSLQLLGADQAMSQTTGALAQRQQAQVSMSAATTDLQTAVDQLGKTRTEMSGKLKELDRVRVSTRKRIEAVVAICDDPRISSDAKIAKIRKTFEGVEKDLQAEERVSRFEIQRLMSVYNEAETHASNALKKYRESQGAAARKP